MAVGVVLNGVLTALWMELVAAVAETTRGLRLLLRAFPARPKRVTCSLKATPVVDAAALDQAMFVRDFLRPGVPVVVRGAIKDWPALTKWTPAFFVEQFGDCPVDTQDNLFRTISSGTVRESIEELVAYDRKGDPPPPGSPVPYLRYHIARGAWNRLLRLCGLFSWIPGRYFTHECFLRLSRDWHLPAFFPTAGFSLPFSIFGCQGPTERFFHDFGIYVSPKGAVTRLHFDGSRTHAVLCQVQGRKSGVLFPPELLPWFFNEHSARLPPNEPDFAGYPEEWKRLLPAPPLHFTLETGDMALIPKGWLHEVYTDELSVTLTFNFNFGLWDKLESLGQFLWYGWITYCVLRP